MKKLKILLLIVITFSVVTPLISYNLNNNLSNVEEKTQKDQNNNTSLKHVKNLKNSEIWKDFKFIHITGANWSIAASNDWCNGSGTLKDPYIIKNIIIDAGGSGSGILIENSNNVYFEITNCTVSNSGEGHNVQGIYYFDAGIKLYNTSNGKIINNECSQNKKGIYIENGNYNMILGNTVNNNDYGIHIKDSNGNIISENTVNQNDNGIYLELFSDSIVLKNTVTYNDFEGIFLQYGNNNSISGNIITYNTNGIYLTFSINNTISRNTVYNNWGGISMQISNNNTIWGNLIKYNYIYGIWLIDINCKNNKIYFNTIKLYVKEHAKDYGTNTQWDNLGIGNYWNTHKSPDSDDDGIVDTPYTWIAGDAGSNDSYPLIEGPVHDGEKIYIDDSGANAWNWSKMAKLKLWCSGSGTEEDPYVIHDLFINLGGWKSSILIENSNAYFRIENCQIYNAINAIKLYKTTNGKILNNDCSDNSYNGIVLEQSNNNNISGNIVNNNNGFGILIASNSDNNTISRNNANNNEYGISLLLSCKNNTISGNSATDNEYGIILIECDNNSVLENTVNNNIYGINLLNSNNNTVSRNLLVLNVFFIEEDECIENIIKKNKCYTTILPSGTSEFEIEPYGVDDVDVGMGIALNHETEVIFSAFNENNIKDAPIDNGLIFMNLWLNDTNNLDQNIDAPINFILDFDSKRYIPLNVFWFNESANDGQGAWKELSYIDLSNGKILISVNHTSIFAITGLILPNPSSSTNGDDVVYDFLFLILIGFICSLTIAIASSTYYHKTRIQTRAKLTKKEVFMRNPLIKSSDKKVVKSQNLKSFVENKNVLRILEEKNAMDKPILFHDVNSNFISNEFWEEIVDLELEDKDKVEFINELLSFTPKERQEIIDEMLILKKIPLAKSYVENVIKSQNLKDYVENRNVLRILKEKNAMDKPDLFHDVNSTFISNEFWEKIEDLELEDKDKIEFMNEMLSFTPKERQEIIDEMLKLRKSDLENANQQEPL